MGRKNKVFEPKGQKETMDLLKELFAKSIPSENQQITGKELDLGGYGESGFGDPQNVFDPLTGMLRDGARVLINTAVRCELEQFLRRFEDLYLEDGRAAVRNGYHPRREVQTGIGPVTVQIPKVRSRDGSPRCQDSCRFF